MATRVTPSSPPFEGDHSQWTFESVVKKLAEDVDWTDSEVQSLLECSLISSLDKNKDDDRFLWALIESKFNTPANWGFFRRTCAFFPPVSFWRYVSFMLSKS